MCEIEVVSSMWEPHLKGRDRAHQHKELIPFFRPPTHISTIFRSPLLLRSGYLRPTPHRTLPTTNTLLSLYPIFVCSSSIDCEHICQSIGGKKLSLVVIQFREPGLFIWKQNHLCLCLCVCRVCRLHKSPSHES